MPDAVPPERFTGCLLGQACGDAVAAPYEGLPSQHVYFSFGDPVELVRRPREKVLRYTDDTQMMIGVAEVLADGELTEDALIAAFACNYDPGRCYGPGTRRLLDAVLAGEDWRALAETQFPGGSLGNGAAMRAAPVGLVFADDLDAVADRAARSALPTHRHPVGVDGAVLLALAVALASRGPPFDRRAFFGELRRRAATEEFRWCLGVASRLRRTDRLDVLGNGLEAHRSVATSIACFAVANADYTLAVGRALSLGGDVDTLAAMTGAISGAHLGVRGVPRRLLRRLEDGPRGRAYLEALAGRLHARHSARRA